MRISADETDPGYQPLEETRQYAVFFNGVKVERCITADEEKGVIYRYALDDNGRCIPEGDHVKIVEEFGEVVLQKSGF